MERQRAKYYRESRVRLVPVKGTDNLFEKQISYHPRGLVVLTRNSSSTDAIMGWALCNHEDQFVKSMARRIAYGRQTRRGIYVNVTDLHSVAEALEQLPYELRSTALWLIEYENRVINRDLTKNEL